MEHFALSPGAEFSYKVKVPKNLGGSVDTFLTRMAVLAMGLLCLATAASGSTAKDFLVDVWRFDDDLPRDGIMSIGQGKDGYLWVSSRFGLARFDGVRFVNFVPQLGASFLGYHYANIAVDPFGAVWIATPGGGLSQWEDQQLRHFIKPANPVFGPVVPGLTNIDGRHLAISPDGRLLGSSNGLPELIASANQWGEPVQSSVCQDKQGSIWFVTYQHKLVRVHGTNAQEMTYGEGDLRRNWIALQTDATGQLWAGTQRDVGVWKRDQFEPVPTPEEPFPVDDVIAIPNRSGVAGAQIEKSRLWFVSSGRAWLREGNQWKTNVLFEPSAGAYETSPRVADQEGNLWFTTTKASIVRAGVEGTLLLFTERDGLPSGRVAALYQDVEGSLWVGIEHAGLARLRERTFTPLAMREGSKAPLVWALVEDSAGAIWLATENNGLQRWQEGKFTQFSFGNGGLPGSVYSLCLDRHGTLWAGTGDKGIFRFDNGKFVSVWEYPQPGWNKRIYVIYEDHSGQMWFGTGLGLFCWHDGAVRQYLGKRFDMGVVRTISEDADGRLWVGLSQGAETRLACIEGEELVPRGVEAGLVGYDIFGLHADTDGTMWIGTVGGGLWHWRQDGLSHYTVESGLRDDRIYAIEQDWEGNLWLGSPTGIFRISKGSLTDFDAKRTNRLDCLVFNRTDGLPTRECSGGSQPSIYRGRDLRLLFAMAEGAVALAPDRFRINRLAPKVLIEEVRVDGKSQDYKITGQKSQTPNSKSQKNPKLQIPTGRLQDYETTGLRDNGSTGALRIGPGRHTIEFHYTATSLLAPAKVRFRCRLDGVDERWREMDTARSVMYSLTAPGDYRFHVSACNNDGVWNETGTAIAVSVTPYLWQIWWFKVGAPLVFLAAVGGAIRFIERGRLQRRLEQLERQQVVEKERARIARDIHDELGASLTEIGLLSEFAQRESPGTGKVRADIQKIGAKARSSTRALDEIVWAVNPRNDTPEGFVSYACAYAEEQLRLANIRCRLGIVSPLPGGSIRADTRHQLFMAFKESLNNVIRHANASQVEIRIEVQHDTMTVRIIDNGCGFSPEQTPTGAISGNGLSNMKERLNSVGGVFECQSAPSDGTRIAMTIKFERMG